MCDAPSNFLCRILSYSTSRGPRSTLIASERIPLRNLATEIKLSPCPLKPSPSPPVSAATCKGTWRCGYCGRCLRSGRVWRRFGANGRDRYPRGLMSTVPHCRELLRSLGPLKLLNLTKTDKGWVVEAEGHNSAVCPACQTRSRSRHSRYGRSLRDLPLQGAFVILKLHLSRWRCRAPSCNRTIFAERLPELCLPNAQRTVRSGHIVGLLGHALGGRPAQRLAKRLGVAASRDTLLRHVKKMARRATPGGTRAHSGR